VNGYDETPLSIYPPHHGDAARVVVHHADKSHRRAGGGFCDTEDRRALQRGAEDH
jgi:hypothetical protein